MAKPVNVDTLEKTISFLQKREGIDKALKIVRYTSRLVAAVSPAGSETQKRFDALQSSVGTSRKAYRLGKFLQDVQALRKLNVQDLTGWLELVTYAGEGLYYFLDQFLWLMKTGVISKAKEKRIAKISAYAEAAGYAANITLNLRRIAALRTQEQALVHALASQRMMGLLRRVDQRQQRQGEQGEQQEQQGEQQEGQEQGQQQQAQPAQPEGSGNGLPGVNVRQRHKAPGATNAAATAGVSGRAAAAGTAGVAAADVGAEAADVCSADGDAELLRQLRVVRYNRLLRTAFVVQDLADAMMALSDITDARYKSISHPVVLSLAGLVSAAVSTYKYWQAS